MSKIFDGPWSPPRKVDPDPPEMQFLEALRSAGMDTPKEIIMDGKIHRFDNGKKKGKTGWYVLFDDDIPAGRAGCWRDGIEFTFKADIGRELSLQENLAYTKRMEAAKELREKELARSRETASGICETIWNEAGVASPEHPYLKRKGIDSHGARVTGDGRLVVPLMDIEGTIKSLQYISDDGGKLYHKGGETGGKFWLIGVPDQRIYFAEGFATAATIYEATDSAVVVCYSANNLPHVVGAWREQMGVDKEFIIVADNDKSGTGQMYADQAAAKHGARVIIPPEEGDANDYAQAGNDLKQFLEPVVNKNWFDNGMDLISQPAPVKWLVKNIIQHNALIMVHGPSGGGKTFTVLDWVLHMCAGLPTWRGHKVTHTDVAYLAGEGHIGLRGRLAAWHQHHKGDLSRFWMTKDGCDLNTNDGYMRAVENIKALPRIPKLIVVDTLHRFLNGDENSAQDAKTMLDACGALMLEFGCSVLLVHHTGVSQEAQHRARGSSAWRGALDIEISITPNGDGGMTISQKKAKDSEQIPDMYAELQSVPINGWKDEDGAQISSAIVVEGQEPKKNKTDSPTEKFKKNIQRAWDKSGKEVVDGMPYISRAALKSFLMENLGYEESNAKQHLKPSDPKKTVGTLLNHSIIEPYQHGYHVICPELSSSMLITKD